MATYVTPVLAAGLVGVAVATVPWQVSAVLVVVAVGAIALFVARVLLRPVNPHEPAEHRHVSSEDPHLRLPRVLYYVGAATIGFLTVRPALGFTASDWIFFLAFGVTCLVLLTQGVDRDYLIPPAITVGVVLFSVGGLLSSFGAVAPLQSVSIVVRLLYLTIVWFWLGTIVLQTRQHVEYAGLAWVASAALSSAGAVIQYFYGNVIPGGEVAWGRMTGFTPHFNVLGGLAATAVVPALMFAVDSPRRPHRLLGIASVGLVGAGLLLSGSVGSFLAASLATVFWLAVRGVTRKTVLSLVGAAVAALVLMTATGATNSPDPFQRIKKVTSEEKAGAGTGGTLYARLDGYGQAWSRIQEQPLVGVGLDEASSQEVLGPKLVHNMLINPWFSAGILGLVGIVLVVGGAVVSGCRAVRESLSDQRSLTSALLASVVAFAVTAMGEPILFVRYGWFPAALLIALRAQKLRAEAPVVRRVHSRRPVVTYAR